MEILNAIKRLLISWGIAPDTADTLDHFLAFALLVLIALAADQICRRVVLEAVAGGRGAAGQEDQSDMG